MVNIYVSLINQGKRTLEQVPSTIRKEVEKALSGEE